MPTYEYECAHCKKTFDLFQQITAKPISKCPKCGNKVKRLIGSGSGIIFKGSGFYATDYRKGAKSDTGKCHNKSSAKCNTCPHAS